MAGLEIGLVVIGILIFAGSFLVTEKLSSSDMKEVTRISKEEIKSIVEKEIEKSEGIIDDKLRTKLDDAVSDFAVRTDDEYVSKMNQLSEYSEKILETMNKTSNEIVFIHSMLSDKQENVTTLATDIDKSKSQLLQLKSDIDDKLLELKNQYEDNLKLEKEQAFTDGINAASVEKETIKSFGEELIDKINSDDDAPGGLKEAVTIIDNMDVTGLDEEKRLDNILSGSEAYDQDSESNNDAIEMEIVNLYKEGYSEIDIAKKFAKGIGEIKLILGLYN